MELFYTSPENVGADEIVLDEFERRHMLQTLRKSSGDTIFITDGQGTLYRTRLTAEKPQVRLFIESQEKKTAAGLPLALAVGFIRPNRLDFILEKGTELGVSHFYLIRSAFSNYGTQNINRFQKILRQAIKQSVRYHLPQISAFASLQEFIDSKRAYDVPLAAVDSSYPSLFKTLSRLPNDADKQSFCLTVGPEGGFKQDELGLLKEANFQFVSLGAHRLRTETAAISGISLIQQYIHY
jgi:16S rRNA (uracil1498-N3)-methyltransferase